jgi:hypothetical protein
MRSNGLRFSCGPQPAATPMNLFLWFHARQLQTLGYAACPAREGRAPARRRTTWRSAWGAGDTERYRGPNAANGAASPGARGPPRHDAQSPGADREHRRSQGRAGRGKPPYVAHRVDHLTATPDAQRPERPTRSQARGSASHPRFRVVWFECALPHNDLRFSCGPQPAAGQMNLFLWFHARQLQAPG